ncbi:unnamed protein product [Paramecium sonneborni]|uniref:Uncharacterized protein n=1 Tax=Paramecium sonneborni TaxID=65129 RepID=A0A8S1M0B8_9CILI|nr:unnamed protein product [Paramecium sonneborni]
MGCLFGKQEQAQNRYQMKEYDKFKVLQLSIMISQYHLSSKQQRDVFNFQSLGIFITKQGAWYMKQLNLQESLDLSEMRRQTFNVFKLSTSRSTVILLIVSNIQIKFQVSSEQFTQSFILLDNLN